ncbi:hypothetical protein SPICUR_05300 [Spiribacter curvatus]|uniref:Ribbon-helix-helix domain-containing protein n=1 Tax=Spiribacter curvatus TaxID=1335757 RepID=U5T3K9_9GAMM|nr:ribbon-helix-helix domain-containing protein [Spiribacter curvatus]AGY92035.1 hypothetical protein SPICUR_05300 [Spiribacter curvatus]
MCEVYASTPQDRYDTSTRSVRLSGFVTSIRLENEFWSILESLSAEQRRTVPQFIAEIHDEVVARQGEVRNLASLLRVCCARYLADFSGDVTSPTINAAQG